MEAKFRLHDVGYLPNRQAEGSILEPGNGVKIKEGPFENFDGTVDEIFPGKGQVRVIVTIFGRATPVDLEYWQVEKI